MATRLFMEQAGMLNHINFFLHAPRLRNRFRFPYRVPISFLFPLKEKWPFPWAAILRQAGPAAAPWLICPLREVLLVKFWKKFKMQTGCPMVRIWPSLEGSREYIVLNFPEER